MHLGGGIHIKKAGVLFIIVVVAIPFLYVFTTSKDVPSKDVIRKLKLKTLLAVAIHAAEVGGSKVVAGIKDLKIGSKGKTKEGVDDSVTSADYISHCAMVGVMKAKFPELVVISEEHLTSCPSSVENGEYASVNVEGEDIYVDEQDVSVWIDPLDATLEYTEKLYQYVTTMVCVAINGKPVMGVIHEPFSKNTSWAWVDVATSSNLKKKKEPSNGTTIIVSRSHQGEVKSVLAKSFGQDINVVVAAGAGYKALRVANGDADAYIHLTTIKKWDICAGNAILEALGGKMTTKNNKNIVYFHDESPVVEDGLVATLKQHQYYIEKLS